MADEDDDLFDLEIDDSMLRAIDDLAAQQAATKSKPQPSPIGCAVVSVDGTVMGNTFLRRDAAAQRDHCRNPPVAQRSSTFAASARPYTIDEPTARVDFTADPPRNTSSMGNLLQKDLFGKPVAPKVSNTVNAKSFTSTNKHASWYANSAAAILEANAKVKAIHVKKWDHTRLAKSGAVRKNSRGKASKSKDKGKARRIDDGPGDEGIDDYDDEDGEGLDMSDGDSDDIAGQTLEMKIKPDRHACETFVYPLNKELRKYQYDIVTKAFYTDTLVALPTGLGKTFLAAVLMLNFYRWFPEGKLIFMAPSRPLVTQQIAACHGIAGIPLRDAVELTGKDLPDKRADQWRKRRVFYCTPQTVKNDLLKRRVDPRDIVCFVVDEAHKATGDYAYTEVVRYMMRKNPNFRLLALTATPGGDPDAVQTVIDNLHIGNIEVRTDESLDIRPYIHQKKVELVTIPVDGEIESIRERFAGLMDIILKPLQARGLFNVKKDTSTSIHAYAFQSAQMRARQNNQAHAIPDLLALGSMARCVAKLLVQSVSAFYESLKELKAAPKGKLKSVTQHPNFASILRDAQDIVGGRDFEGHPKMVKLRELVLAHFEQAENDGTVASTRIMVFCSFREVVDEIVERLNRSEGIHATRLVGQGSDTKGRKGLAQKQQNQVLSDFKKGTYNVLVATSIGEEGLDIGELDLIICYEAPKSSIRTLQRAGRTGRAKDGKVIVLMTAGTEDTNWKSANDSYKGVQNAIVSGRQFELYADCQRLIPSDIRPIPDKRAIEIEIFDPEQMGIDSKRSAPKVKRKQKGKDDAASDAVESNFQKADVHKIRSKALKANSLDANGEPSLVSEEEAGKLGSPALAKDENHYMRRFTKIPDILRVQPRMRLMHTLSDRVPHAADRTSKDCQVYRTARVDRLLDILTNGRRLSADPQRYKRWESDTYPHFRNSNVEWWSDSRIGSGRDRFFRTLSAATLAVQPRANFPLAELSLAGQSAPLDGAHLDQVKCKAPALLYNDGDDDELPELPSLALRYAAGNFANIETVQKSRSKGYSISPEPIIMQDTINRRASALSPETQKQPIVIDLSDDSGQEGTTCERTQQLALPSNTADSKRLTAQKAEICASGHLPAPVAGYAESNWTATTYLSNAVPSQGLAAVPSAAVQSSQPESSLAIVTGIPRKRLVIDEDTSSPGKVLAASRVAKIQKLANSSSPAHQARKIGRLVRNGASKSGSLSLPASESVKTKKRKPEKLPGDQCPFFDVRAVNSDDPDSQTDSELDGDGHPESAGDRHFVDSDDVANPHDMSAFYRESLMSQANHRFAGAVQKPGAYKFIKSKCCNKETADPDASQWHIGSFVVDDEDDIVYTDDDDGLPQDGDTTSEAA